MTTADNYHFTVGGLRCIAISDGRETLPAGEVVRDLPGETWTQSLIACGYSPSESSIDFNCLYIDAGGKRILVDAGWGTGTQRRDGPLLDGLLAEGISPADIHFIVITHGDVDHVGGLLDAQNQLVFSNAQYIMSQAAWDFWTNGPLVAKWPPFLTGFARQALPLIRNRIVVAAAGDEFWPGFRLIDAPGHRPGHSALSVTSDGEHLLHLADVVGHPLLMEHPSWHWAMDAMPAQAEKDKAALLSRAVAEGALAFSSHLPFPGVGRVAVRGDGWCWQAVDCA